MDIFEGAKFGDKFKTKDGRYAVFTEASKYGESVYCYVQDGGLERYNLDGTVLECNCPHDIVGKREDEPVKVTVTEAHDCSKCVRLDWCEKREKKPIVINGKCMKYWERKTHKVRGIDWYNMDVDERVNHPIWKEMSPRERLAAIALESRPEHSVIKEFKLIDDITNAISEKYPSITELKYTIGYEQGMKAVLNYLDDTTKMEILKRIKESYEKTDDKSEE